MARSREDIKNTISALFAKANDKGVTEAEAFAFLNRANDLLIKYNISEDEISTAQEKQDDISSIDTTIIHTSYGHIRWRRSLLGVVSQMFFCKGYIQEIYNEKNKKAYDFCIVGKEHNRAIAASMLQYLEKAVVRLSREYSSKPLDRYHFEQGAGLRLYMRIAEKIATLRNNSTNNQENSTNSQNLPALYSQELTIVEKYCQEQLNFKKSRKAQVFKSNTANSAGWEAGEGISLDNQLEGSQGASQALGNTRVLPSK